MLGTCGGLLSLFVGLSFLSFVELIYYVTLRLCCHIGKRRKDALGEGLSSNTRQNNEECSATVINQIHEYAENCTLHGVNYIGDKSRHWFERFEISFYIFGLFNFIIVFRSFWVIMFFTSLYFCILQIISSIEKWKTVPTVTTADTDQNLITEIPYPAFTICPMIKINFTEWSFYKELSNIDHPPGYSTYLKYF